MDKVSEVNDEVVNIQDTYATVDEVNNVLTQNYALKSDIPDAVDLSGYALKSEIPAEVDLSGYALKSEIPTKQSDFYNQNYLDEKFENIYSIEEINAEFEKYTLKSDYETLKAENAELKATTENLKAENAELKAKIQSLQPKYPWQEYYPGFTEKVEFAGLDDVGKDIYFMLDRIENNYVDLFFEIMGNSYDIGFEYLLVLTDCEFHTIFIRVDLTNSKAYLCEYNPGNPVIDLEVGCGIFETLGMKMNTYSVGPKYKFNYVFRKSVV